MESINLFISIEFLNYFASMSIKKHIVLKDINIKKQY